MKKAFLLLGIAAAAIGLKANAGVMYWQVGDTGSFTAGTGEGQWSYARVGYYLTDGGSIAGATYSSNHANYSDGLANDWSQTRGALYYTEVTEDYGDGGFAVLPDSNPNAYTYFIELGTYSGGDFTAIARSGTKAGTSITAFSQDQLSEFLNTQSLALNLWTGGSYTAVPEPTSSLMLLVGLSMLALRRRRG